MPSAKIDRFGVTGHQTLPVAAEALLIQRLSEWFPQPERVDVVCSLASGADSIAAEYLTNRGADLHAVIPCKGYEATFESPADLQRYRKLLGSASVVETLGFESPTEDAFMAAGALVVRSSEWLLAVWDGEDARGLGGTGDIVAVARSLGKPVRIVWPEGVRR